MAAGLAPSLLLVAEAAFRAAGTSLLAGAGQRLQTLGHESRMDGFESVRGPARLDRLYLNLQQADQGTRKPLYQSP
ncbi:MAG: hypothetical protein AB1505_13510 [Candidatus Latescibacterota bacterium]